MRKFAIGFVLAGLSAPAAGHAQVMLDTTRVTCADYLAMPPEDSKVFSAWMSGWFNQKGGYTVVDLDAYARNVGSVQAWCKANPRETVIAGLTRATAKPQ